MAQAEFEAGTASLLQREETEEPEEKEEEEEPETVQTKRADEPVVQRREEEEKPVRAKLLQRQGDEEELQNQPEDDMALQAKLIAEQITPLVQREPEEGVAQAKFEDGSASLLQREEKEEPEEKEEEEEPEPVQTKRADESIVQRLEDEEKENENEEEEKDSTIQQKTTDSAEASSVSPSLSSHIKSLRGGGQPLPSPVRDFFEPRFGSDFSQVRVHTDARAAGSAKALKAKAFTVGRDIVFGAGQYEPASGKGRRLLAHELTHVVQQNSALQSQITPIQKKDPVNSRISREEQRRRKYPFGSLLWHYRRRRVTSRQIQGTWQFINLRRVLHADYTEAIKACKLILKDISTDDKSKWNRPVKYYLRQVRKQAGLDKYNINKRFVDKYHPEWSWKNIKPNEQTNELATRKQKRTVTFRNMLPPEHEICTSEVAKRILMVPKNGTLIYYKTKKTYLVLDAQKKLISLREGLPNLCERADDLIKDPKYFDNNIKQVSSDFLGLYWITMRNGRRFVVRVKDLPKSHRYDLVHIQMDPRIGYKIPVICSRASLTSKGCLLPRRVGKVYAPNVFLSWEWAPFFRETVSRLEAGNKIDRFIRSTTSDLENIGNMLSVWSAGSSRSVHNLRARQSLKSRSLLRFRRYRRLLKLRSVQNKAERFIRPAKQIRRPKRYIGNISPAAKRKLTNAPASSTKTGYKSYKASEPEVLIKRGKSSSFGSSPKIDQSRARRMKSLSVEGQVYSETEKELVKGIRKRVRTAARKAMARLSFRRVTFKDVKAYLQRMKKEGISFSFQNSRKAMHAEVKQIVSSKSNKIYVTQTPCESCRSFLRAVARFRKQTQIIVDPDRTWVFKPDGSMPSSYANWKLF